LDRDGIVGARTLSIGVPIVLETLSNGIIECHATYRFDCDAAALIAPASPRSFNAVGDLGVEDRSHVPASSAEFQLVSSTPRSLAQKPRQQPSTLQERQDELDTLKDYLDKVLRVVMDKDPTLLENVSRK
jgi:hypothetical protein